MSEPMNRVRIDLDDPKQRIRLLLAIFLIPLLCFILMGLRSPFEPLDLVLWIPNTLYFALPQIVWTLFKRSPRFPGSYWSGLAAAHVGLMIFVIALMTTPNDGDGTWVFCYYALAVPLIVIGALVGRLFKLN